METIMEYGLYASLAANALAAIGGMVLAGKLAIARQDLDDAREDNADLLAVRKSLEDANGSLLAELSEHRARAEKVREGAARATAASAAARKAKAGGAAAPRAH
jgi:hypothetical protein